MIIIANKAGKLGNRMIVFAHFIACALEHNVKIVNPAFDEYAGYFQSTKHDILCRYPFQHSLLVGGEKLRRLLFYFTYYLTRIIVRGRLNNQLIEAIALDWEDECRLDGAEFVKLLKRKRLIFAQGWKFRGISYFTKHADSIREYFKPLDEYGKAVAELLGGVRRECDVVVGVHIRLGDYSLFKGGKYFFNIEKYIALMKQVDSLFGNRKVGFLVCSNEKHEPQKFSGLRVFFGTGQPLEDMYGLAGCDYIMGPPSTFSMWASFYGEVPLYQFEDADRKVSIEDFSYSLDRCAVT
jgi:hypothetical protein